MDRLARPTAHSARHYPGPDPDAQGGDSSEIHGGLSM